MLGIFLAVIASLCIGVSIIIQKQILNKEKKFSIKKLIRNKIWVLSAAIGNVGALLYTISLSMTSFIVVQIIISASFLIPIIGGAVLFKEKLGVKKWLSICAIIIGVALATLS